MNNVAFSFNIFSDLQDMLQYDFMVHAFEAGTIVAVVAGVVGYFVVLRRSSFAAHAARRPICSALKTKAA